MHGLGNDFVVLDARREPITLPPATARAIADRHRGIGFDQLLIIEPSDRADAFMRTLNADGSESGACGNGTRCVGRLLIEETGRDRVTIETRAGLLSVARLPDGRFAARMGRPRLDWRDIPLAREMDTLHLQLAVEAADGTRLADPAGVNMGNPHAIFFVEDAEAIPLAELGPRLEHDPLFPERANIGIVSPLGANRVRYRVWERGVGITLACGSGACAALVASARRGVTGRHAELVVDGGLLEVRWREEDDDVELIGPATLAYEGRLGTEMLPDTLSGAA
ncbi:Diaminopimelate epimerase [Oceanibacterium hippocampi]|uniref:Diaminopimelate epimerase n=2 Tax=Oceanibacterium hippocampi TaxID=745714 RepID=A0A1Y5RE97_9PROT|nr:Diaminopimelate epimerase [Oceanibacterium hippocampi]